ncbi:acetyl-CoA carboxylase biotin carboxyl carrier protein [bacterium]|nr:acetyl-CoA carboxylase biotin carboxyl carrier protein [bacterium]
MATDIEKLKEILKLLEKTEFSEIEWEEADFKIKVKKSSSDPYLPNTGMPQQIYAEKPKSLPNPYERRDSEITLTEGRMIIRSPLVGTFYRSPNPNAPAFVNEGDEVKAGQVLCIIEAMKLMNEVECDRDGKVVSIMAENAHPVEYGEPLFILEAENI